MEIIDSDLENLEKSRIIYKDDHFVAINKPPGLLVHPTKADRYDSVNAMKLLRNYLGKKVYPVHRLDKATSGILLFALNPEAARKMTVLFQDRKVQKRYLSVVRGFTGQRGEIDYPLKETFEKMTDTKARKDKLPQPAVTRYTLISSKEINYPVGPYSTARYSLVEIIPLTGRKHQIRRHMKHIFHPVIGDTVYGDGKHNFFFREKLECPRLLLHAFLLVFMHPFAGKEVVIKASLDKLFQNVLETFEWHL